MRSYFVYIVECSDGTYYTGVTNDVERRVGEHNFGLDERSYTFTRRPVELVFSTEFKEVNDAIQFEKQLKGWSRAKKRAIIEGRWHALPGLDKLGRASTGSAGHK